MVLYSFFLVGTYICYLEIDDKLSLMHFFDTENDDVIAMELFANCSVTTLVFEKKFMEWHYERKKLSIVDNIALTDDIVGLS